MRKSDYETFIDKFKPEVDEHGDLKLYETYDQEWKDKSGEDCEYLWTVVAGDSGKWWICPGFHFVNRMNYIITSIPHKEGQRDYLY